MPLPDSFADFLGLLVLGWIVPGVTIAAALEQVWPWWEGRTGHPIRPHDKVLIAALVPPVVTLLAWAVGAWAGYFPWTLDAAWGAFRNGAVAAMGGQAAFGTARRLVAAPATTVNNTTNIASVAGDRDVYVGSTHTEDAARDLAADLGADDRSLVPGHEHPPAGYYVLSGHYTVNLRNGGVLTIPVASKALAFDWHEARDAVSPANLDRGWTWGYVGKVQPGDDPPRIGGGLV